MSRVFENVLIGGGAALLIVVDWRVCLGVLLMLLGNNVIQVRQELEEAGE